MVSDKIGPAPFRSLSFLFSVRASRFLSLFHSVFKKKHSLLRGKETKFQDDIEGNERRECFALEKFKEHFN